MAKRQARQEELGHQILHSDFPSSFFFEFSLNRAGMGRPLTPII
jgi:hypothetical protein